MRPISSWQLIGGPAITPSRFFCQCAQVRYVRIYDERLENIDERVLSLTLDIKTRAWIERVEERAREHLRTQAKQDTGTCAIERKRVGDIPGTVIPS